MQSFGWWLRKELREHRVTLVLLAVVVLGGSWFLIDQSQGQAGDTHEYLNVYFRPPPPPPFEHRWNRMQWELLVVAGLVLTVLVLAGGLFSGEARRGTLTLMARTPGALRTALSAKIAFLVLVAVAGTLLQGLLLGQLAAPYGLHERFMPVSPTFVLPQGQLLLGLGLVLGLGAWILVASSAIPLIGLPALVGFVAGVGTIAPALIWHVEYPYLFRWWLGSPAWFLCAWASVALALVAWAWSGPIRHGRSAVYVGLCTLAVAVAFAGLSAGAIAVAVARYRTFDSHASELRIDQYEAYVGPGGRFLYAEVYRGDPDGGPDTDVHLEGRRGTPFHAWRIDLVDGSWAEVGGERFGFWPGHLFSELRASVRVNANTLLQVEQPGSDDVDWVDGRTGEVFARTHEYDLPSDVRERMRSGLRISTRVRDAAGRPAWFLDGVLEREGAHPIPLEGVHEGHAMYEIPGGWACDRPGSWERQTEGEPFPFARTIDASDGRMRTAKTLPGNLDKLEIRGFFDPQRVLLGRPVDRDQEVPLRDFRVWDLDAHDTRPILETPRPLDQEVRPRVFLGQDSALAVVGTPGSLRIAHVALSSGDVEVLPWAGIPLEGVRSVWWDSSWNGWNGMIALPGQGLLLSCFKPDPDLAKRVVGLADEALIDMHGLRMTPEQALGGLEAWVLYDPATRRLRVLRGWAPNSWHRVLFLSADGSLLAVEEGRRIVRLGPEPGQREVLFPRR